MVISFDGMNRVISVWDLMPLGTYLETEDIGPQVEIIVIINLHQKDSNRSTPLNSKVVLKEGLPK